MPRKSLRMAVERTSTGSSLVEVLDRVLDKGIVIDAWVRLSLVGIDLVTVEARIVVASIATYLTIHRDCRRLDSPRFGAERRTAFAELP